MTEIVIAAPYEKDGRGAVYLFSGSDLVGGKTPRYLQRFYSDTEGAFGLSLAPIQDYDDNGCNGKKYVIISVVVKIYQKKLYIGFIKVLGII